MNKRISQLKALSAEQWQALLSSLVLLPLIALALKLKGFKWSRAFLGKRVPEVENVPEDTALQIAQSVASMVSAAANHGVYRANCLPRSLLTWWLLQRKGISAELNIGVNTQAGSMDAHAWVEYKGNILIEKDDVVRRHTTFGPQ